MKTAFAMWKYTRMIVLVALCAALYAVAINISRIPGPAAARAIRLTGQLLPMPLSLLFGPAAAWGVALGDLISNLVIGNISMGAVFGFFGNFLLGYLPYAMWTRLRPLATGNRETPLRTVRQWVLYVVVAIVSAFATAVVIAWPIHMLGMVPYSVLMTAIGVQDAIVGSLAGILLLLVYRRIAARGLVYWEVMDDTDLDNPKRLIGVVGSWLVLIAAIVAWGVGGYLFPSSVEWVGGAGLVVIALGAILMW